MALCPSPSANTRHFFVGHPSEQNGPRRPQDLTRPFQGFLVEEEPIDLVLGSREISVEGENTIDHDSTHGGASMLPTIKSQGTGFPFAGAIHPAKHLCRLALLDWIGHELLYCEE